jgi:coenzyme F420-reducing hydrogenase alpha subunit
VKTLLTRVEGEGSIVVVEKNGYIDSIVYEITEAPRFFEYIVLGRDMERVVDIVSRVCGLCGVSYSFVAAKAFEKCLGVDVDEKVDMFREAVHLAERVKSHAMHLFYMNLPDLVKTKMFTDFLQRNPEISKHFQNVLLWSRKAMYTLGGRFHNVVNIKIGGVYRFPDRDSVKKLVEELNNVSKSFKEFASFILSIKPPDEYTKRSFNNIHLVSLYSQNSRYPHHNDKLYLDKELYTISEFFRNTVKTSQLPYSTALHYRIKGVESYIVGPLARFNQHYNALDKEVRAFIEMHGWKPPLNSVLFSYVARIAEIYNTLLILEDYLDKLSKGIELATDTDIHAKSSKLYGTICEYAVEAPRGILYHRYNVDKERVISCDIVTPTAQNLASMSDIATAILRGRKTDTNSIDIAKKIAISFDPCISCSVHTLKVRIVNIN